MTSRVSLTVCYLSVSTPEKSLNRGGEPASKGGEGIFQAKKVVSLT